VLSDAADSLIGAHDHNWRFGHGSGNGITCAIGDGRHLWSMTESQHLARFLQDVDRIDGREAAVAWLERTLQPETGPLLWSRFNGYPHEGYADVAQYRQWISDLEWSWNFLNRPVPGIVDDVTRVDESAVQRRPAAREPEIHVPASSPDG
jgi:hypothetical protein